MGVIKGDTRSLDYHSYVCASEFAPSYLHQHTTSLCKLRPASVVPVWVSETRSSEANSKTILMIILMIVILLIITRIIIALILGYWK